MSDLDAMSKLESLRKKERNSLKEGLVQAVMVQPVSFEDKIKRIEMIDMLPDEPPKTKAPRAPKTKVIKDAAPPPPPRPGEASALPPPLVDPSLAETKRVEHYRRRLAKEPFAGGIWRYLIREYGAIVRFGARTTTLARGVFPFTLKLSDESLAFLGKTLPNQVLPVLDQTLPLLLKKSWLHLTKFEYNLLVALRELSVTARVTVPEEDKAGGGKAWDPVFPLLRLFWTTPDLVQKTLSAWEAATTRLNVAERQRQQGNDSIRTLLETRTDTQSLPDVLLALLMLRTRRMLSWDEGGVEAGEFIVRDSFDCSPDVQEEIDKAADILVGQLEALAREGQEIQRIRYYLPAEDLLSEYGDSADQTLWCQGFLPRADRAFTPLLEGTVVFADGTQTQLFQNPTLSSSLVRLRLLESQLTPGTPNPELLSSVARVLMNLGKTLVMVIRNRSTTADPLARSAESQPSDPLPFETSVLDLPLEWAGLTVVEALVKLARVCLQAGRLLGETSLETSLEKEGTLPGRVGEIAARLTRLLPTARLEELRGRGILP